VAHHHKKAISAKNIGRKDITNVCEKRLYNYNEAVDWPPHGTSANIGQQ